MNMLNNEPMMYRWRPPGAPETVAALSVMFREQAEKNEDASKDGIDRYDNVLVALVGPIGSKSNAACEIERRLPDNTIKQHPVHSKQYAELVKLYKDGNGELGTGTALGNLPGLDPGMIMTLRARGVHSIESLAELSDNAGVELMGFREFQDKAKKWVALRDKNAPFEKMASDLKERDDKIARLERQMGELITQYGEPEKAPRKAKAA